MTSQSTFGDLLRRMRTSAGLTQEQLGTLATLSTQTVSSLERGTRSRPRRETVLLVATALGLSNADTERLLIASRDSADPDPSYLATRPVDVTPRPRTLPPSAGDFTGRKAEVAEVRERLQSTVEPDAAAIGLVVITGMGGVGKTSLALRAAHQVSPAFTDGQLYVDLGGFGPNEALTGIESISTLLIALGMPAAEVPTDLASAVGRYRSFLAGKRVLLVLDNALDARQIDPLLPTSPGSAAIITSRRSIVIAGGKEIRLGVFSEQEALAALASTSGRRFDDEIDAASEIVRLCGYLPLALRIIGARLAARPSWPLAAMSERLADQRRQLDELDHHDLGVRRSLALSIEQLSGSDDKWDQQAVSAIFALPSAPGPDFSTEVAAALLDQDVAPAERLLERLVDNALLETNLPGRYRFHDLLRAYVSELAPGKVDGRLASVLRLYARSAWQASDRTGSVDERLHWYDVDALGPKVPLDDRATIAAAEWLKAERRNVAEAAALATPEHDALVVQLAIAMLPRYVDLAMHADLASVNRLARKAATRLSDVSALGILHHDAGAVLFETSHADEGLEHLEGALDLFRDANDEIGQAMVLRNLTHCYAIVGQLDSSIAAGQRGLAQLRNMTFPQRASQQYLYLGMAHGQRGDTQQELAYFERAIELAQQEPAEFRRRHNVYKHIAIAHRRAGRLDESARLLRRSVEAADQAGQSTNKAIGLVELARTQLAQEQFGEAFASTQLAIEQARAIGIGSLEARGFQMAGQVLHIQNDTAGANDQWRTAQALYERLGMTKAVEELDHLLNEPQRPDIDRRFFWYDGQPPRRT